MKKEFQGLMVEKVQYDNNAILTTATSTCTKWVAYNDNDNTGLCDEAEYPDHPDYGNYVENWISPNGNG